MLLPGRGLEPHPGPAVGSEGGIEAWAPPAVAVPASQEGLPSPGSLHPGPGLWVVTGSVFVITLCWLHNVGACGFGELCPISGLRLALGSRGSEGLPREKLLAEPTLGSAGRRAQAIRGFLGTREYSRA